MRPPTQGEREPDAPAPPSFWRAFVSQLFARPHRLLGAFVATPVGLAAALASPPGGAAPEEAVTGPPAAAPPAAAVSRASVFTELAHEAAATCPGLPASVLVAIGKVESDYGRDAGVSSAGARGPMQFLPTTWKAYAIDGDGDGRADIDNTADALHSAAGHLCANGGADPGRLPQAIWNYNHSRRYVDAVLQLAGLPEG